MRNFFQAEASNRTERPDLCLAETMKRRSDTMKRTMKRALFPLMLALVLLLPATVHYYVVVVLSLIHI